MGVLLQRNGALYIGDFYRDMISGYGMFIASEDSYVDNCDSCTVYIGNWKNGVKSGFGIVMPIMEILFTKDNSRKTNLSHSIHPII